MNFVMQDIPAGQNHEEVRPASTLQGTYAQHRAQQTPPGSDGRQANYNNIGAIRHRAIPNGGRVRLHLSGVAGRVPHGTAIWRRHGAAYISASQDEIEKCVEGLGRAALHRVPMRIGHRRSLPQQQPVAESFGERGRRRISIPFNGRWYEMAERM
ncbi:MAG: hypothetical protein ACLR23_16885 [Clostridia bacterium]